LYSFKIKNKKDITCSEIYVDQENNDIGCISLNDNNLEKILEFIINSPYITTKVKEKYKDIEIIRNDIVKFSDERFMDILQYKLQDKYILYDKITYNNNETLKDLLEKS